MKTVQTVDFVHFDVIGLITARESWLRREREREREVAAAGKEKENSSTQGTQRHEIGFVFSPFRSLSLSLPSSSLI